MEHLPHVRHLLDAGTIKLNKTQPLSSMRGDDYHSLRGCCISHWARYHAQSIPVDP